MRVEPYPNGPLESFLNEQDETPGTPEPNLNDKRAPLEVNNADLPSTATSVIEMLSKRTADLYYRDGVVTVARDPLNATYQAHGLTVHGVSRELHKTHRPFKWRKEGDKYSKAFITLPERVALMALDDRNAWSGLSPLDGFCSGPMLHEDGTIVTAQGYDPKSRMYCYAVPSVRVPERPTDEQAKQALLTLRNFFRTFVFADAVRVQERFVGGDGKLYVVDVVDVNTPPGQDESAALHALFTAISRPNLWLAPACVVTAPGLSGAGAGKGLLVRVICAIAFGIRPTAITAGHDGAELDKRIASSLMEAHQVVMIDNLNGRTFKSDTLESAITERPAMLRPLGTSRLRRVAVSSFIALTGNALRVSEDMARRVLRVDLDAGMEDPETRRFKGDILKDAFANRTDLLEAALIIWRWGRLSPDIKPGLPMGSFDQWCAWVRDPLINLGCADPAQRIAQTKMHDPRRAETGELFSKWNSLHGDKAMGAADLHQDVKDILDPAGR
ncbi:MAG: hypothetical protein ABMA14_11430, partial [Hyphomonadaceae bacterium]